MQRPAAGKYNLDACGEALRDLLTRMVIADERGLDVQRQFSNQFQDVDKRLSRIEGALRVQ